MEKVIRRYRPGRDGQWATALFMKLGFGEVKPDKDMTWVVTVDGEPVGIGAWDINPDDLTTGLVPVLWVEEKYRRQGVGTLVLRRVISELRKVVRRAGAEVPLQRVVINVSGMDEATRGFLVAMKFDVTAEPPVRKMLSATEE